MSIPFLAEIDIASYTSQSEGLDPKALAYFGHVFAKLSQDTVKDDDAFLYLQQTFGLFESYFDVTNLESIDDLVSLLDSGAAKIFVTNDQLKQLGSVDNLDQSRVVPVVDITTTAEASTAATGAAYFPNVEDVKRLSSLLEKGDPTIFVGLVQPNEGRAHEVAKLGAIPIVAATSLTIDPQLEPKLISAAALFLARAESDRPDGLFTTLVTDERGVALGLVYSSQESVRESLKSGTGVYQSRKRGLWYKGATSGDIQELVRVSFDCDQDCLQFTVRQKGRGFCHLATSTCFGNYKGLAKLQKTLLSRKESAPQGSYTKRLFDDPALLRAKILEEANELCDADSKENIAFEAADLLYFALTKCVASGVSLEEVEQNLDAKSVKVKRRRGNAKAAYVKQVDPDNGASNADEKTEIIKEAAAVPKSSEDPAGVRNGRIAMTRYVTSEVSHTTIEEALQRPSQKSTEKIMNICKPIIQDVQKEGDAAVLRYTHQFEKATSLKSPVITAPFPDRLMQLPPEVRQAIDTSFDNIWRFHAAQKESKPLVVETMSGVECSRFSRPIARVGLYVPGGTAVLPSTALMLGVPAKVAGCEKIVIASPPRGDGSLSPEIVYIAQKVGAESIVLAGGAQAVAALAYGTQSISKVDKILGPGNQFVTAAKMLVANDTSAGVAIDMPAGPSEVLVVADKSANPAFVAADLLSQAEHGPDSQVVCIAVNLSEEQLGAIEDELHRQANALPRKDIVRGAIEHSVTLVVENIDEAMRLSNIYAPEHLILQVEKAEDVVGLVQNAGSVFIGPWTPESVGDYSAGVNHALPTYGYAKQYSGVNLASYVKHITSSRLTEDGLRRLGGTVEELARVEGLNAHERAVSIRLRHLADNR
ncbi:MAG: trifunctional histidinol dehydrogenase [Bathelium mastoideum]|nr:MAG: trifunctional histidinol dehydrogenase [Bathelium mastoideum]KAI9689925.1 MAG: trifunctional histidinol dehydrogenase [Bathelium mastoideum]